MLSVALRGVNIVANYSDQDMLLVKIQYCILHWQVQLESIGELLGETLAVAAPAPPLLLLCSKPPSLSKEANTAMPDGRQTAGHHFPGCSGDAGSSARTRRWP
jgi:hypothetical protein